MTSIRKHREVSIEILVYALYILAVISAFWWISSNHFVLSKFFGINDTVALNLDSIASIIGIVAAALAIIISNRQQALKEQQASKDQIYQQLELESNKLFRFEIEKVELARIIWDGELAYEELQNDKNKSYQVLQHICQILNLFEMAVRFKRSGIVHEDVFKSWEAWIFDLCKSEIFLNYWYINGVKENYIILFQNIIEDGLRCAYSEEQIEAVISKRESGSEHCFDDFRKKLNNHLEK